jgi:outer membrane protein assembly factor BamB
MKKLPIVLLVAVVATPVLFAENWPAWRGPDANGVSRERGLPLKWSTEENITWKVPMPAWSGSTPIVWGERIFLNMADGDALQLWALDRTKGDVLWKKAMGGGNIKLRKQNMSSPSPVTDGKSVFALTGTGVLKGFEFSGNELWARDLQKEYGAFGLNWGYASSPLLYGDSLYVQVLHGMKTDDPSYVMRVSKTDGKTIWKVERPTDAIQESPDAYTTPALLRVGKAAEIVISGGDYVTGHDPATGKELWRVGGMNPQKQPFYRTVTSPVVYGDVVYAAARERPVVAIRGGGRGDVTKSHVLFSFNNGPDVPTPIADGKYFYVFNDRGIVWCLDAKTGQEIWGSQRLKPATYSSSPVLAEDRIYITNEEGLTSVIKAGPTFEVLAENALNDYCLSSPAISDGQIFMRTTTHLWAIGQRKE